MLQGKVTMVNITKSNTTSEENSKGRCSISTIWTGFLNAEQHMVEQSENREMGQ